VRFRGVRYYAPCMLPSRISGKADGSVQELFEDVGENIAHVLGNGIIEAGNRVSVLK